MFARVAQFEGAEAEAQRRSAAEISSRAAEGPPEGVPAKGFLLLIAPDDGRTLAISLFETEDDMRAGDAVLNEMSPPDQGFGSRASVGAYEVVVDERL